MKSWKRDVRAWWNPPFPVFARITSPPYSYSHELVSKLFDLWIGDNPRAHCLESSVATRGTKHIGSVGILAMHNDLLKWIIGLPESNRMKIVATALCDFVFSKRT